MSSTYRPGYKWGDYRLAIACKVAYPYPNRQSAVIGLEDLH